MIDIIDHLQYNTKLRFNRQLYRNNCPLQLLIAKGEHHVQVKTYVDCHLTIAIFDNRDGCGRESHHANQHDQPDAG